MKNKKMKNKNEKKKMKKLKPKPIISPLTFASTNYANFEP